MSAQFKLSPALQAIASRVSDLTVASIKAADKLRSKLDHDVDLVVARIEQPLSWAEYKAMKGIVAAGALAADRAPKWAVEVFRDALVRKFGGLPTSDAPSAKSKAKSAKAAGVKATKGQRAPRPAGIKASEGKATPAPAPVVSNMIASWNEFDAFVARVGMGKVLAHLAGDLAREASTAIQSKTLQVVASQFLAAEQQAKAKLAA